MGGRRITVFLGFHIEVIEEDIGDSVSGWITSFDCEMGTAFKLDFMI
jgi:hypothetical protein